MEKLYDINRDGYSIRCKYFCNDIHKVEKVILFGHGFGGNKDNKTIIRFAGQVLPKYKKVAVVCFDWPCHGMDARKKLSLPECETYLQFVLEDTKERFGTDQIYAYATSFGAYLMLKFISEHGNPFQKMAFRSVALNIYESITDRMLTEDDWNKLRKGKEVLVGYERKMKMSEDFLAELKEADIRKREFLDFADEMIIFHGTKDSMIPFAMVEEFAEENVIEFIPVENADHGFKDLGKLDVVSSQILDFFEL